MSKQKAVEPTKKTEIEELREKLGLSVQEFALKVGVREYTVERWERNESKPSPMARKLMGALLGTKAKGTEEGVKKSKK